MFGSIFDPAIEFIGSLFDGLFTALFQLIIQGIRFIIFGLLYKIFTWICILVDFVENLFKSLAGINPISLDGAEYGGTGSGQDLVYAFITDEGVLSVFWSIMALSLVLLLVFTMVAFIKSEFTLDLKGSAKGPIIARSLKSAVNLIAVPVISIIAIFGINFLTRAVYNLFGDINAMSLSQQCFLVGAAPANRARLDSDFAKYLTTTAWLDSGNTPFSGSKDAVADAIDEAFKEQKKGDFAFRHIPIFDKWKEGQSTEDGGKGNYSDWQTLVFDYPPDGSYFSYTSLRMVNYFYDVGEFQYLFAIGSAVALAWTLLTICLVLVKRVFELTILFLLAPPMTAIAPLDGGQAEKKWRQEFSKRLLSVVGTIFAYNMYFLLIPIFQKIEIFGQTDNGILNALNFALNIPIIGFFNNLFQIICVIVGISIVKTASGLVSSLLGIEDLVKSGGETAKKAFATGTAAIGAAAAVTSIGIHGTSALIKGGLGIGKTLAGKVGAPSRYPAFLQRSEAKSALKSAQSEHKAASKAVDDAQTAYDAANQNEARLANQKTPASEQEIAEAKDRTAKAKAALDEAKRAELKKQEEVNARGRDLRLRKLGMTEKHQKKFDEEADKVRKARAGELEGVDENSEYYKQTKASIEEEAEEAFSTASEKHQKWLARGRLKDNIKNAYDSEFGENTKDTSLLGKATGGLGKILKNEASVPKFIPGIGGKHIPLPNVSSIPFLGKAADIANSLNEWAGVSGGDNRRRLQDMVTKMLGDSSGAEAFRTLTNKNARAKLFESIPEEKIRGAKIDNENTMKGRDIYAEKKRKEDAQKEALDLAKRFIASRDGLPSYDTLLRKKEEPGLSAMQIEKIDANIKKMEQTGGVNSIENRAKRFLKDASSDDLAQLQKFKDRMQFDATKETIKSETAKKEIASAAAAAMGQSPETKIADSTIDQLAKAIANALANPGGKGIKYSGEGIKIDPQSLANALGSSLNSLAQTMQGVADAIKKMNSGNNNNGGNNNNNNP